MKSDKPVKDSGKTHYNRIKNPGQSWTESRDKERKKGKEKPSGEQVSRSGE